MANLSVRGLVDSIGATVTRESNGKTYVSRALVLNQPRFDPYSGEKLGDNFIQLEASKQEICDSLNNYPVGTKVDVEFSLRGSKYQKKDGSGEGVFTKLEIRNITFASAGAQAQAPAGASPIPTARPVAPAPVAPAPVAPAAPTAPVGDYDPDLGF